MSHATNLLFICSRNQWRSPTAEKVWGDVSGYRARSAGTSPRAKRTVNASDLRWADHIFVMEKKHRSRMIAEFTRLLDHKPIHVLDIPDAYQYMDPELIMALEISVSAILKSSND